MSKDNIQEVVKKSLEKYFRDLGEQDPSNVYEMVVFTDEPADATDMSPYGSCENVEQSSSSSGI